MNKGWKAYERRIAKLFGSKRVGASGHASPDIFATIGGKEIAIETKVLSNVPMFVKNIMEQAKKNSEGKIPLCIVKEKYAKDLDALVFTDLRGFLELLGGNRNNV